MSTSIAHAPDDIDRTDVSVIGLGEMGSALARALLAADHRVTVWNRTPDKSASLVADGAKVATSAHGAALSSPVTVVCMSSYDAMHDVLGSAIDMRGRTLVQLSSGTPEDARAAARWATPRGANYLDGAILAWPRQIGGPDATLIASGPESARAAAAPLLDAMAGNVVHLSDDIAHASVLAAATLSVLAGRWIGFSHGALICEAEGFDVEAFGATLARIAPILGEDDAHMGRVVAHNRFTHPESTLGTAGRDVIDLARHAREALISNEFPCFAADLFQRGIDQGYESQEHVALIKVLRSPAPAASVAPATRASAAGLRAGG
jgi:3-hydroxyisobutyrate dehydrogenase-like beta-hydroxyacid dehydrogenase